MFINVETFLEFIILNKILIIIKILKIYKTYLVLAFYILYIPIIQSSGYNVIIHILKSFFKLNNFFLFIPIKRDFNLISDHVLRLILN